MAEYYVDGVNGDDSNSGTSKDQAWATVDKAMQTLAAGDICHIRPGIYRQTATLTPANSGDATNGYIEYIGDINGEIWGEKGEVIITNMNTTWDGTTFNGYLVNLYTNTNKYIRFKKISFYFGNTSTSSYNCIHNSSNASYNEHNDIIECKFVNCYNTGLDYIRFIFPAPNSKILRNIFTGWNRHIYINGMTVYIENNIFVGGYPGIYYSSSTSSGSVYNNIFIGGYYGIFHGDYAPEVKNNLFIACQEDSSHDVSTYSNNYSVGIKNTRCSTKVAGAIDFQLKLLNQIDKLIDAGADITLQEDKDFYSNPRKLKTGIDIGAVEYNPPAQKETTEVRTGSYSLKLPNASFKDIKTFLSAGSYTVSVYVKWSGYSGSDKPQLIVKQDKYCGIDSDQVATATGDGSDWEQLSVNITLTKDAEITIRLYARDTGSSAVTYFDDLSID